MTRATQLQDEMVRMEIGFVSDPAAAAEAALNGALNYCASKMKLAGPQAALDHLRTGDQAAHGYFKYALARQVADYLAGLDVEVKAVYLYDFEATAEDVAFGEPQPVPHLIVRAQRKTEALYALSSAFDSALAGCYAGLANLPAAATMLDVQFVDDGEVANGLGHGALLNSINLRPMLVWER